MELSGRFLCRHCPTNVVKLDGNTSSSAIIVLIRKILASVTNGDRRDFVLSSELNTNTDTEAQHLLACKSIRFFWH